MRRPTIQLFIVLVLIVAVLAILTSAQLFATADGPLKNYLPAIFNQSAGSVSNPDDPGGDDGGDGGDSTGGDDDVYVYAPTGFEIEGNLALDGDPASHIDWETTDFPPAAHIEDPNSKLESDPTTFKPDGKFDKPESWTIQGDKVGPGQNELTNILSWLVLPNDIEDGRPSDPWLVMGMERTKKEGTFFLDFEYNQLVWDPAAGGLTRTPGDVVVGFELKGNPTDREKDLSVLIVQFLETQPSLCEVTPGPGNMPAEVKVGTDPCPAYGDSGFYYRFLADGAILADSGLGEATMNAEPLPVPAGWNSTDSQGRSRDVIPPFQFAEAAINLSELGIPADCGTFSSMHAKDRSSLEPNADLKDLASPVETEINCKISGHKFLDLNADGAWQGDPPESGLAGWEILIENTDTGWSDSTVTDADGFYEFEALLAGTYEVSELCPTGEDWLQTKPGFTDFDGCGSETYTIEISLDNREDTDNDFGNIDPALEVQKQCPADVFVGDDILYEITVTNSGSPTLSDISVDDSLLGHVGDIGTLTAGASATLTGTIVADAPGTITNTATASTNFVSASVTGSDDCVTERHKLDISKDAISSHKRIYVWNIDKVVDETETIPVLPGDTVTVTYTIRVTAEPRNSDFQLAGTITITNPAPIDAELASVSDVLSNGVTASVDCPPLIVPAEGTLTCTYTTGVFTVPAEENTATAIHINNNGDTTAYTASVPIVPGEPTEVIDETADVTDDAGTPDDPSDDIDFGEVNAADTPKEFIDPRAIGPIVNPAKCDDFIIIVNTATVTPKDSGDSAADQASAELTFFLLCTITVSFEDKPIDSATDWDYNDFVAVIDFQPVFLESGNLSEFTFSMFQEAGPPDFTAAEHTFFIKPDGFVGCGGTYTKVVDGVSETPKPFVNGQTQIVVIPDSTDPPSLVLVTIDFTDPGGCPFDLEDRNPIGDYHCNNCFSNPILLSERVGVFEQQTILRGDVRMLRVLTDWQWPAEKQRIWDAYACVGPPLVLEQGPVFQNFWWRGPPDCTPVS